MRRTLALCVGAAVLLVVVMASLGYLDVHVLAHSRFGQLDRSVDPTLARHRTGWLNAVTLGITDEASTYGVIAVAIVAIVAARIVFKRWHEPLFVVCVVAGEVAVFVATTLLVHRTRPNVVRLDHAPPTSSFPSGHTAASVALWGAIAVLVVRYGARVAWRRAAIAVAVVVPIAVACARLYRGMHYPTDVLGGAMLGLAWLRASTLLIFGAGHGRASAVTDAVIAPRELAAKASS